MAPTPQKLDIPDRDVRQSARISDMQKALLARAKPLTSQTDKESLTHAAMILHHVLENLDSGEGVHRDWVPIYEWIRPHLPGFVSKEMADRLTGFFGRLSPLDPGVEDLDPKSIRVAFLLGAGASKPKPSSIPTVKELLPQLLDRARRLDRDDVTKLAEFCEAGNIDNIEDLLTAAQLLPFAAAIRES